jgi:hypothetical protein
MKILHTREDYGDLDLLDKLTDKYYSEFEKERDNWGYGENGCHPFWVWCEYKFKFKIDFTYGIKTGSKLVFKNDKDYLAFALKEL